MMCKLHTEGCIEVSGVGGRKNVPFENSENIENTMFEKMEVVQFA